MDKTNGAHPILERNRQIIEQYFYEVWNAGNLDKLEDLITPDYINHSPSTTNPEPGPTGLKPIIAAMRAAFPDLNYQIEDLVITEDKIVARVIMRGTQSGDFFGLPPTNKKVEVSQMNIEAIRDGKISQHWRVTDELKLMQQLGIVGGCLG